jgi:hypothetical protein
VNRIQTTCGLVDTKYLDGVDGAALLTFLHLYLRPTSLFCFSFFFWAFGGGGGDGGNGGRKLIRLFGFF